VFKLSVILFTHSSKANCCRGTLSGAILFGHISLASFSTDTSAGKVSISDLVSNSSIHHDGVSFSNSASSS
jgi:hypothetical protein